MSNDKNLLQETKSKLDENKKNVSSVLWVGSADGTEICSWKEFAAQADFDYDAGYGGAEIRGDLVVVGKDWWLERGEYDGSEWWEFKTLPKENNLHKKLDNLKSD